MRSAPSRRPSQKNSLSQLMGGRSRLPPSPPPDEEAASIKVVHPAGVVVKYFLDGLVVETFEHLCHVVVGSDCHGRRPRRHTRRVGEIGLVEDVVFAERADRLRERVGLEPKAAVDLPSKVLAGKEVVLRMDT